MTPGAIHLDAVAAVARAGPRNNVAGKHPSLPAITESVKEHAMVAPDDSVRAGDTAPLAPERVAEIRDAIRAGTYPLLPVKVADAMIAAHFLLVYSDPK